MKKLPFFLLLIFLLEIIISVDSQSPSFLKFVLQWPPTFCKQLNSAQNRPARCYEPIPQHEFTLHGLEPANAQGDSLTCPVKPDPDWNKVFTRDIENKLMEFWPPLRENSPKRELWEAEWRAHGVCGGTTAQVYFDTAIKINNMLVKGNLFNYLKTNGIIACDSLSFAEKDIVEAIQKVFITSSPPPPPPPPPPPLSPPAPPPPPALNVYLTCIPIDSRNKTHVYLSEVILCTNTAGTSFRPCPTEAAPTSCSSGARIMLPHPKPQPPEVLKFVLQWPPTFCIQQNSAQPPVRCNEPIPQDKFTLHGLWPANAQGNSLTCAQTPDPNWNQLFTPTIENQLMTFWSPLRANSQKRDLWKHEWRAHGSCGGTTAQVYFNTAIKINNMIEKGNLFNYLKESGIIASDTVSFTEQVIVEAIQKVFVKRAPPPPPPPPPRAPPPPPSPPPPPPPPPPSVYLTCIRKDNNNVYLKEVTLCTNKDGTRFISCPSENAPSSCSRASILLPLPKPQPKPRSFQEETDGIYPTFEQSWVKYTFND